MFLYFNLFSGCDFDIIPNTSKPQTLNEFRSYWRLNSTLNDLDESKFTIK